MILSKLVVHRFLMEKYDNMKITSNFGSVEIPYG